MEIEQLKIFLAVAEELHFGRAAQRLHLAQPPVSRRVRQLEQDLGVELFIRSTRNVQLTSAGRALVAPAREILAMVQAAKVRTIATCLGEAGTVSLAYAGASTHILVCALAREMRKIYPAIEVKLYNQNFALPALSRILRGEIDICLGRWDSVPSGVCTRIVAKEHLVVALPASHHLARRDGIHVAELSKEQWIALPADEGSVLGDRLRRLSLRAGFNPHIVQRAPDSWTAMALVGAEVGCSLTLSTVAENLTNTHIRFLPLLDETLPISLQMAWREDTENPALGRVLGVADQVWFE